MERILLASESSPCTSSINLDKHEIRSEKFSQKKQPTNEDSAGIKFLVNIANLVLFFTGNIKMFLREKIKSI
jgi:hypothetical protein